MRATSVLVISLALLFVGCSSPLKPILAGEYSRVDTQGFAAAGDRIVLKRPALRAIDTYTEAPLPFDSNKTATYSNTMRDAAYRVLSQNGYVLLDDEDSGPIYAISDSSRIDSLYDAMTDLYLGRRTDDTIITQLSTPHGVRLLLFQSLLIKADEHEWVRWNIFMGDIDVHTSTSTVRGILIDAEEARIVWQNEVFVRGAVKPRDLTRAVELLLSTVPQRF